MRREAATGRELDPGRKAIQPPGLVGREHELAVLGQAFADGPSVVLVE